MRPVTCLTSEQPTRRPQPMINLVRKIAASIALAAALFAAPSHAQPLTSRIPTNAELLALGFKVVQLRHQDRERWFLVLEPAHAGQATSTVVLLHGGTQSMRKLFGSNAGATREWPTVAKANNVLLLVPNGTNLATGDTLGDNQFWNDLRTGRGVRTTTADDVGFIDAMLDWSSQRFPAAASRVFVTGASNGGMMTYRLLIVRSERFTAAAAFVAALPADSAPLRAPARPVPMMMMSGTRDPLVKWQGGSVLGNRGSVISAPDTAAWWIVANRATASPTETSLLPDVDLNDGCRIERRAHAGGPDGASVVFYTMQGGGHAMPTRKHPIADTFIARRLIGPVCRDIEAVELVWGFFRAQ